MIFIHVIRAVTEEERVMNMKQSTIEFLNVLKKGMAPPDPKAAARVALKDARKAYLVCEETISNVVDTYQTRIETDEDYDKNVMLRRFDYMVQYIMMQTVHNEKGITDSELMVISRKVVKNGDLLYFLRMNEGPDLSWDDIKGMSAADYETLIKSMNELIKLCAVSFITPFVEVYRKFGDKDIEKLDENINLIIYAAMMADGRVSDQEYDNANAAKQFVIIDQWNAIMKEGGDDDTVSGSTKTLRDYYIERLLLNEEQYQYKELDRMAELPQKIMLGKKSDYRVDYNDPDKGRFFSTVIYIEVYNKKGDPLGSGSGFVITEDGWCITCSHVVEDCDEIFVKISNGHDPAKIFRAVSMFCNKLLDMAIIRLEEGHYNFISIDINRKYPEVGEPIEIYGYPMGSVICDDVINLNLSLTRGYVSSNQVFEKLRRVFIDGDARHGNSGGPIVSMETGKVIGMLHGSIVTAQSEYDVDNICYTIPIKYLKTYFIMANEGK